MKKSKPMKIKVTYIKWERNDAIGKVTSKILENLRNKVNFNIITLKIKSENRFLRIFEILKNIIKVSKLLLSRDIIHFEEPKTFEPILNLLFKHKKSILTVHHLDENNQKNIKRLLFFKNKQKHNSFSKLIAVSKKTKTDLIKKYKINPNKIKSSYLGVDKKIFKPTNKKSDKPKRNRYIFYIGSEVPRKNIGNLLKGFKKISFKYSDLILLKAGEPEGKKYRKSTNKLIKQYGLTKKVFFVSKYINEKELPLYYSNAELFIYPSLKEGFGMPLVEAMACGCPIVTSNISPMKEIAKGQVLVNPYDPDSISRGIDKILSNKKYRATLKEKALKRAKDFDWGKIAKKTLDTYKELQNKIN